jgi:hypothetical protein
LRDYRSLERAPKRRLEGTDDEQQSLRSTFPSPVDNVMKRLAMVFLIFLIAPSAFTQPQEPQLLVATRLVKPFVFEENGAVP